MVEAERVEDGSEKNSFLGFIAKPQVDANRIVYRLDIYRMLLFV